MATCELEQAIAEARLRQAEIEAKRQREGGVYDPLLRRWVAVNEARKAT